jgi:hypothetical protein
MIVSVVNDVLSTIDDVCDEGFRCIHKHHRWSTIHHLQQTQSYTPKTFNINIINGRQYIIYNRHNHIHVKPSTQTSSMVNNTSFTTMCWRFYVYMIVSVVNDVLSTIDGVCVEGFTCIWLWRKTVKTNTIDGRQYIIYNRHNHIHLKPSSQTPSMVDNTSFTTDTIIYS